MFGLAWPVRSGLTDSIWLGLFGLAWPIRSGLACSVWPSLFCLAWPVRSGLACSDWSPIRSGLGYSVWPGLFCLAWPVRSGLTSSDWPLLFGLAWHIRSGLACLGSPCLFDLAWPFRSDLACSGWPGLLLCLAGTGTQSFLIRCGVSRFTFIDFCCQNFTICCYCGVHNGPGGPERCLRGSWGSFRDDWIFQKFENRSQICVKAGRVQFANQISSLKIDENDA